MPIDRARLYELALENLESKKRQIDSEIAALRSQLRGAGRKPLPTAKGAVAPQPKAKARRRSRFSKEERVRRAARMKAYWANWRKEHGK